jgi:hypothetical protein
MQGDTEEIAEYIDGKKYVLTEMDKPYYTQCSQCAFAEVGYECVEDGYNQLLCNTYDSRVWKEVKIMNKLDITKQEDTAGAFLAAKPKTELVQPKAGTKYDSGKPRYSLLPPNALEEVAKVLTYGSLKYDDHNWMKIEKPNDRFFSAANRHMWAWQKGELTDSENGCNHLAAAIASLMFILELEITNAKAIT